MEVADHAFLDGRLTLREPRRGHRSGTDAILLAAAVDLTQGQHFFDVGAGAGAVALTVLARAEGVRATLIERDSAMAALARHNIEANGFGDRAAVVEVDLFDRSARAQANLVQADVVVSNPPFYLSGTVRVSSEAQRAASHVLDHGGHGDWMRELMGLASPKGRVVVIHRPEAMPTLIQAAAGRGAVRLRSIHPRRLAAAHRIILQVQRNRRHPFAVDSPLILHDDSGHFTEEAEALHRGATSLAT